jgi:hypothetical protein
VEALTLARRDKSYFRGCRSEAKKNDRERGPRHCASSYQFVVAVWRTKEAESAAVKYWELVADKLSKAGWSLSYVSALDS